MDRENIGVIKKLVEMAISEGLAESITDFSCYDCGCWQTCEFAFDGYCTHGDCLAEK